MPLSKVVPGGAIGLRPLIVLCGVSLVVRLAAWWLVVAADVTLLYDEQGYFMRGLAWREAFQTLLHFNAPGADVVQRLYGLGHWPPLHPAVLGLGMLIGGPTVAAARLVMVVLSTLTTLVICRLAADLFDRRVAIAAGAMHALYPTFIAFSHYLWSETTYLLLIATSVHLLVRAATSSVAKSGLARAAGAGFLFGASCLTHATGVAYLLIAPMWLALQLRGRRLAAAPAGVLLLVGTLVILPWLLVLGAHERRPVLLSTLGGYNLALGNNPWIPADLGSSWGHETSKARLHAALAERAGSSGQDPTSFGFDVAVDEIASRPGGFAGRMLRRLQQLWTVDFFPLRHVFNVVYAPIPPRLAAFLALIQVTAHLGMLTLVVVGLREMRPGPPRLMLFLAVVGMILPAVSVGIPRFHVPLLGLLLPAAGCGLLVAIDRSRPAWTIGAILAVVSLVVLPGLRPTVAYFLLPSSYYASVIAPLDRWLGLDPTFSDQVLVQAPSAMGAVDVRITSADASYGDGTRSRRWDPGVDSTVLVLEIISRGTSDVTLAVGEGESRPPCSFSPVTTLAWRRWQTCGSEGVSFQWSGGGSFPLSPAPRVAAGQ